MPTCGMNFHLPLIIPHLQAASQILPVSSFISDLFNTIDVVHKNFYSDNVKPSNDDDDDDDRIPLHSYAEKVNINTAII